VHIYVCTLAKKKQILFTCGFFWVTAHETEPATLLFTVAEKVKETNLLQIHQQTVHILREMGRWNLADDAIQKTTHRERVKS